MPITDPTAYAQYRDLGEYLANYTAAARRSEILSQPAPRRPPLLDILQAPGIHPEVRREAITALGAYQIARNGGGRVLPFEARTTPEEVADAFDIDPGLAARVHQEEFDRGIAMGLQERMGTDADGPPDTSELSLRETIEAAIDLSEAR